MANTDSSINAPRSGTSLRGTNSESVTNTELAGEREALEKAKDYTLQDQASGTEGSAMGNMHFGTPEMQENPNGGYVPTGGVAPGPSISIPNSAIEFGDGGRFFQASPNFGENVPLDSSSEFAFGIAPVASNFGSTNTPLGTLAQNRTIGFQDFSASGDATGSENGQAGDDQASRNSSSEQTAGTAAASTEEGGTTTDNTGPAVNQPGTTTQTDTQPDLSVTTNAVAENADGNVVVGTIAIQGEASGLTFSLEGEGADYFEISGNQIVVKSGVDIDFETNPTIDFEVVATGSDGTILRDAGSVDVTDLNEGPTGIDWDATQVLENAGGGTLVGTLTTADTDAGETFTYELSGPGAGLFEVVGDEIRVRAGADLDFEAAETHALTVTVTDSGGNTFERGVTVRVDDVNEFDVSPVTDIDGTANELAEDATEGSTIGITASAADGDTGDVVTYSVDDNRFTIDANGVVKVGSGATFDAETEGSIDIVVTATSSDGSTSQETFSLNVSDIDEFDVGVVTDTDGNTNTLAENASEGTTVGVTASAADADITDTVSYSVDDNRFAVDANGVVKVASGASFDAETEGLIDVVVTATSTDGSTSQETFSLNVSDIDEADVGAVTDTDGDTNTLAENASEGLTVGVTASATDADITDTVSYSVDDNRFTVDANGVVKVASGASFDFETETAIDIVVTATSSDGSTSQETFSLAVSDINESGVGAVSDTDGNADTLAENASDGTTVGVTAFASDPDSSDSIAYSVDDNRFTVDANGVVKVASGASFDAETEGSIDIVVTATSSDGSTSQETFSLNVSDIDEFDVGAVTDTDGNTNTLAENASEGATVGVTASASDADVTDTVAYSVDDNRFTVDANGVVKVASGASFDAETEGSIDIVVTATSTDGSTSQETFSLNVSDIDEFDVGAVTDTDGNTNTLAENASEGATVGVTASASDADVTDTVSYAVDDNRFTVDANGVVKVASGASFDAETEGSIDIVVTATSTDGSTSQETFSLNVSDIDEFDVGAVADTDGNTNTLAENASEGATVGVTASATDADVTDTVSYSVDDNRFTVDANGVVKVASGASFDAETEGSIDIVVTAASSDGSTSQETFSLNVSDIDEFDVGAVTDTDGNTNTLAENASEGVTVGVTASASDADVTDTVAYSVDDNRFTVDANGVVKVASGASFDAETEGSIDIVVTATSSDGSTSQETFSLNVSDIDESDVGAVTDTDGNTNTLAENASEGATVGVTASATDADITDTVSYSVDDNRFTVDANGVVKVASGASFDAETEGSIDIVVTATSSDGSTSQETFSLNVSDIDEADVGAVTDTDGNTNTLAENASEGATVGVTASATDADVTDTVAYSVDDNRFTVDANGVVKVASGASFDAETEGSIDIVVTATSSDGSTSQETFSLNVSDIDEADVGAVTDTDGNTNTLAENASEGATVGVTASASDADITDTVAYSVDDNRFTVDANGVVKVASGASFDAETEGSIDIVVTATSTDGSTSQETFSLNVSDIDEADVGAVTDTDGNTNTLAENASEGATVGVTASASDADITDTVAYSVDDNRFTVDANGVVKVASGASFDAETEGSIDIVVTATSSDGSTSQETFSLNVSDIDESDVGAVTDTDGTSNTLAENASEGATVGVTASATDADITDTVSYSVDDNRFTVDANGVVKVASGASFDAETEGSIDIVVTATSSDGSTSQETFSLNVSDIDESDVGAVTDTDGNTNTLAENASEGATVGVTASASDADVTDTVAYSVDDNRFTVDANGVVKVASGASFDAETEGSIDIVVTATSSDGSTSQETFSLNVSDIDEADVGAVTDTDGNTNTLAENASEGATVGVTASATDADVTDTVAYSVDDNRFTVDANGVVKVASGASFDAETEGSIDIVVTATSSDGSTSQETFSLNVSDIDEADVGAVTDTDGNTNTLAENASEGATVGVTASASDADVTDTVSYSVDDNRFTVDANGVVKVASGASFDAETEGSIDIVVTAASSDGSTSQETFSLNVSDIDEFDVGAVTDTDGNTNTLAENASEGVTVGVTASASDADVTDTVAYSVDDNRFTVDANGVVKVASGASFDAETEGSIDIVVTATSSDGSTSQETFSLNVSDIDESDVGAVTDTDGNTNTLAENASEGATVGVTASASDADVTDTVSYAVDDNRFTVDANGVVKVASGASFDAETEGSIDIVVTATSTDGSTSQETFSLNVSDIDEFDVGAVADTDGNTNTLAENASEGATVGVTASATDADITDTVAYSVDDNRFTIDANGVVKVASGSSFDAETEGSIDIVVTATSSDGSTSQETFSLNVTDIDESDVGAVTDTDGNINTLAENASEGATIGVTASASDADITDTVSYSVDDNRFTVDANGVVKVASGASFDAETEASIDIVVTATSRDGSTSQETFSLNVSDIDEADVGAVTDTDGNTNTLAENASEGATVGVTASATDADVTDTVSYAVDDNRFTVDANGVVKVASGASFDAETEGSIDIVVTATSSDGSTSQETFSLNVSDIDEFDVGAVTDTDGNTNTLAENASEGATVGVTASATDADVTDTVAYSVDDNRFTVDANGVVKVASGASFDAETEGSIDIVVTATSSDGSTSQETFSLNVSDIDESDVGAVTDTDGNTNALAENASEGATVGVTASASDADITDTVAYSVDDNRFTVDANGVVKVASGASFDAETEGSIDIVVTATSSDGSTSQETFSLNVSDIDEFDVGAVTDTDGNTNTLAENASEGATVGVTASASDADVTDTVSYAVDDSRFTVDANGVVKVASGASFDAETEGSIDIVVTATSSDGSTSQETFSLNVSDIDESDVGAVTDTDNTANSLAENATVGTTIGVTASASDADVTDTVSYSVDDNRFTIDANGVVKVAAGATFDHETEGSIDIVVTATSSDGSTSQETFTTSVSDINEDPTAIALSSMSVNENSSSGTVVATLTTTDQDDGDTFTYSLSGDGAALFDVVGNEIRVKAGADLDFEDATSHNLTVTVMDSGGNTFDQPVSISVNNLNEDPTAISLSGTSVDENASGGTVVATLGATDQDAGETFTYSVSGDGAALFEVVGNEIRVKAGADIDFEDSTSHDLTVTVTDSGGNTFDKPVSISVNNLNEGPTALTVTPTQSLGPNLIVNGSFENDDVATGSSNNDASIDGWSASSGSVQVQEAWGGHTASDGAQYLETDAETGVDAVYQDIQTESGRTYDLTFDTADRSGSSTNVFEVYWNGALVQQIDPSSTSWEEMTLSVTGTGGSDRLEFRELSGGNDRYGALIDNVSLKANLGVDKVEIAENSDTGTVVATLAATDEDSGETFTYSISGADSANYEIVGNEIRVKAGADIDYEDGATQSVTVTVTDSGGNTYDEAVTVNVADVEGLTSTGDESTSSSGGSGTITSSNFTDTGSGFTVTAQNLSGGSLTAASVSNVSSSGSLLGVSGSVSDSDSGDGNQLGHDKASGLSEQLIVDFDNDISTASFNFQNLYTSDFGEVGHWAVYNDGVLVAEGDFTETSSGSGSGTVSIDAGANFDQLILSGNIQNDNTDGSDFQIASISYNEAAAVGNDSLTGTSEEELISGLSGDDSLDGAGGNDTIVGGLGDDTLIGGAGNDSLTGDNSADIPTYDEYVATLGPVVHYQFNGDGASVVDSSGNDHSGTYNNGADDTGSGFNGEVGNTSLALDGTDDYVEIPASSDFQLTDGVVSLWFNADEIASTPTLFSRDSSNYDDGGHLTAWVESDGSVSVRLQSDTESHYVSSSSGAVTPGEWSQVSFSWGDDGMKLYVDGQLADTNVSYTGGLENNNEPWVIGANQWSSGDDVADNLFNYLDGEVDEFVVVGNQLDDSAVNDLFVAGAQGPEVLEQYTGGGDSISGGDGNDTIIGGGGSDTLSGGSGDDVLYAGETTGEDFATSGSAATYTPANAIFSYASGANIGDGNSGGTNHSADVASSDVSGLVLTLPTGDATLTSGDSVGFSFIDENGDTVTVTNATIQQSAFAQAGSNESGILTAVGADQDGNQIAILWKMNNNDGSAPDPISLGGAFYDNDIDPNSLNGTDIELPANMLVPVSSSVNVVDGGTGNDTIFAGEGADAIDGSDGTDTVDYSASETAVTADFAAGIGSSGAADGDTFANIEQFVGSGNADTITGGSSNMSFELNAGNDVFDNNASQSGSDTVDGGAGDDIIHSGDGNDNLVGGTGDDQLWGEDDDDILSGGAGADTLYGGSGDDLFVFDTGDGVDTAYGGAGGGWTDTIQLGDGAGSIGDYSTDWTLQLDSGSIESQDNGSLDLSDDASGTITLDDGSQLHFQEIERIVF